MISEIDIAKFLKTTRSSPFEDKANWILRLVKSRSVLDLGCIGHSMERVDQEGDRWLHNRICQDASDVVGLDVLEPEAKVLETRGFDIRVANAEDFQLDRFFDVIVCGDLIEHVSNHAGLLDCIHRHLNLEGIAVVTTPNPLAVARIANIICDGSTPINLEHTCWICPQTMLQLADRCGFEICEFRWLITDFPMKSHRLPLAPIANAVARLLVRVNRSLSNDFGVVLRKKRA
jgi:SAM-dependent methyltransferase